MTEKQLSRDRQAELSKKYGKLSDQDLAKMEAEDDRALFTQVLNNIYKAACDFKVTAEDAEDVADMLLIYVHMLSFDPVRYVALLEAANISATDQKQD